MIEAMKMKEQNNNTIKIEKFSKKRYEKYKEQGIPFRVVDSNGLLCEVRAFDCGCHRSQVFYETFKDRYGKDDLCGCYADQQTGYSRCRRTRLFIYFGPWFEKGDLVVLSDSSCSRKIFFWDGIRPQEGEILRKMSITDALGDLSYTQFSGCCCIGQDLGKEHFRLATAKDIDDYSTALRHHRITWEDDGHFYHYPHVGDHYYEIYFNHGKADFRECILESESTRPEISRLIMECDMSCSKEIREFQVREQVGKINEALGYKPLKD